MDNKMSEINVKKRDGRLEPLDLNKIHRVLDWAAEGLDDVSVSQVELKSHIQFYNGMRTQDIHEIMIKSTADLITENEPDYQYMAARLSIFNLRKIAYGEFTPPHMYDHAVKMVKNGKYDKVVLDAYSKDEYDELNDYIDHWRDMNFSYGAVKQLEGKYLVQNRVTKEVFESPQMLYMFAAMCIFAAYPKETRLDYVKRFYDHTSKFDISLPTPIMSGMRTPTRQFASCTVIKCGDSIDSINASTSAIVKYVSKKAGIGLDISSIRAEGSEIRGGEAFHTGLIPFIKMFQAAVGSSSQGGVRKGSATLTFPLWHKDVESLIVLKNNRGVEDNRARHLDYSVAINGFLYKRLISGKDITLFSPHDVKDMLKAFYDDQEEFARLYEKYEADNSINKAKVKAVDLFSLLMNERAGTGRIYITNIDHMNTHGAFKEDVAPIVSSNLCLTGDAIVNVIKDGKKVNITLKDLVMSDSDYLVLSKNLLTDEFEYKKITAKALTKKSAKLIKITDNVSGKSIRCTPEHKVYTKNRGYVSAYELNENDELEII
jgi:ribonucleoside-diphosphate reductase alpha chain